MAYIRPFRAWRYHSSLTPRIGELISPPFDTVSERQRTTLYQEPYNSIHLSIPNTSEEAERTLQQWKQTKVIQQDPVPAIYVYYQHFRLPGESQIRCRRGFICFIRADYWSERVVLRHEDTLPYSVQDRVDLLAATQLNASPTHGLYTDAEHQLESIMDQSMHQPLYQAKDYQRVSDAVSVVTDPSLTARFVEVLQGKPVILADGHHRYESSLIYRRRCEDSPAKEASAGCRYHMMYLTNTESEDLRILPTHRLIRNVAEADKPAVLQRLQRYFTLRSVASASDIAEHIAGNPLTFGLLWGGDCYAMHLPASTLENLDWPEATEVKTLDTAVLHYVFIDKVLGIPREEQRESSDIRYERSFARCLYEVTHRRVSLALITNGVSIDQVKQICYSGHLMPPKSTYFYPKAVGGFVFGSIKDDEL